MPRIEREVHRPTLRLYIERHTIVITRDNEEELLKALDCIAETIDKYLRESRKPEQEHKKIWWKFMRG